MHKTIRAVDAEVDGDWEVIIHGHKTKNMRAGDVTKISDLFVSDMNGNSSGSLFRVVATGPRRPAGSGLAQRTPS